MTSDELQFCKDWCAAHAKTWQVLNRSQWKYQFHPKTLVRYVDEVRLNETEVQLVLAFLSSDDCINTLSLYDQSVSNTWKPTRAWLEMGQKSVNGVRSVRLYHGLLTELTQTGDGPYVVENGCAYKVSFTYYWNQTNPPTCPDSSSGVSYQVSSLSRDSDTGLYTYAIEKRERVRQDVPLYLTAETVYEQHKEETHHGVKQSAVATTGQQAVVDSGTIVQRKISKNADCTSDVSNSVTVEKSVTNASASVYVGIDSDFTSTTHKNQSAPMPTSGLAVGTSVENTKTPGGLYDQTVKVYTVKDATLARDTSKTIFAETEDVLSVKKNEPSTLTAAAPANGVVQKLSVKALDHGGYQVSEHKTTENAVSSASESVSVTLTGTTRTVTNRSQVDKASTYNLGIGESVENRKTEGGRWDTTIRTLVKNAYLKIAEKCDKTIFAHRHSTTTVQSNDPGFTHVSDARNGNIVSKTVRRTSDGAYEIDEQTTTEKSVESASVEYHKSLRGVRQTITNKSQGTTLDSTGMSVGETRSSRKTEGGLYDNSVSTMTATPAGVVSEECANDIFTHTHGKVTNQASAPATTEASAAQDGKTYRKTTSQNEDGTYDIHETTRSENAVSTASESVSVTLTGTTRTVTNRSQVDKASTDNLGIGESVENRKTEGGRWDTTIRTLVKNAYLKIAEKCDKTIFAHRHSTTTVQSNDPGFTHVSDASNGNVVSKTVRRTSDGAYEIDEQTETEKSVETSERTARMTLRGLVVSTENRNQKNAPSDPTNVGDSVSYSKTPGGLYNTRIESAPSGTAGVVEEADGKTAFEETHRTETNVAGNSSETASVTFTTGKIARKNVTKRGDGTKDVSNTVITAKPWQETKSWRDAYHKVERCRYRNQPNPIIKTTTLNNTSVENSYEKNEFGLYDGQWRTTTRLNTGGGEDGKQKEWTSTVEEIIVVSGVRRIGGVKKQLVRRDRVVKHVVYNTFSNWRELMLGDIAKYGPPADCNPNDYAAYQAKQIGAYAWQYFTFEIGSPAWENVASTS